MTLNSDNRFPETPFVSRNESQTIAWGQRLIETLPSCGWIALHGDLGSGKTLLVRSMIQHRCGILGPVPSPSFTLVHSYSGHGYRILHADFFRLNHPAETESLDLEESLDSALLFVEWPEKGHLHHPAFGSITLSEDSIDPERRTLLWTRAGKDV